MQTIFYSVLGEGRGHATRAQTVIDSIRDRFRIVVYAAEFAHDLLAPHYAESDVLVRRIPGLTYRYTSSGKVDLLKSALAVGISIREFSQAVSALQDDIENESPILAVTDFEPFLPRAASRCGLQFVSLDHQHFLMTSDFSNLPLSLQVQAKMMGLFVSRWYRGQVATIVSSFFNAPLLAELPNTHHLGVLLRPEVLQASSEPGQHIVAYFRRSVTPRILRVLDEIGCEIRVYGLKPRPPSGRLQFKAIDRLEFVEDLATSRALVSTAGNQLIGEALFLRKPVFAIPEPGHFEQNIHAHFLVQSRTGDSASINGVTSERMRLFLDQTDSYTENIDGNSISGNRLALQILEALIRKTQSGSPENQAQSESSCAF